MLGLGNSTSDYNYYLTSDKPVIVNFHGYPESVIPLLASRVDLRRIKVNGYIENGSITTPFDMQVMNKTDRFHLAIQAVGLLERRGRIPPDKAREVQEKFANKLKEHAEFIVKNGVDMEEIENWRWSR